MAIATSLATFLLTSALLTSAIAATDIHAAPAVKVEAPPAVTQIVGHTFQKACLAGGDSLNVVNHANALGWPQFHEQPPPSTGFRHYAAAEIAGSGGGHLGLTVGEMNLAQSQPIIRWVQCNMIYDLGSKDEFVPSVIDVLGPPTSRGAGPSGPEVRWAFSTKNGTNSPVHGIPFDSPNGLAAFVRCCTTSDHLTVVRSGTSRGLPYIAVDSFDKLRPADTH